MGWIYLDITLEALSVKGLTNLLRPFAIILKKVDPLEFLVNLLIEEDILEGIPNKYSRPLAIVSPALRTNSQIYPNIEDNIDEETVETIRVLFNYGVDSSIFNEFFYILKDYDIN